MSDFCGSVRALPATSGEGFSHHVEGLPTDVTDAGNLFQLTLPTKLAGRKKSP